MEKYTKVKTITAIVREIKKNKIYFNHPIQRSSEQWLLSQKSLMIDSILNDYPIPPIYVCDLEDGNCTVLDGKQRLTVIYDYIEGKFKLSRKTKDITIDGKTYIIKNCFFSQLDVELQNIILDAELTIIHMKDCNDSDIEEIFFRLNNGANLSKDQKIRVHLGGELSAFVDKIINNDFFTKKVSFTKGQLKKGENQTIVLQTLMLISGFEYKNFSGKEVDRFALYFRENFDKEICDKLEKAIIKLNEYLPDKNKMLKKISIPMIINGFYHQNTVTKEKNYIKKLNKFFVSPSDEYTKYCHTATSSKENVEGRVNFFLSI